MGLVPSVGETNRFHVAIDPGPSAEISHLPAFVLAVLDGDGAEVAKDAGEDAALEGLPILVLAFLDHGRGTRRIFTDNFAIRREGAL